MPIKILLGIQFGKCPCILKSGKRIGKICGYVWVLKKKSIGKKHLVCPSCKQIFDV